MSRYYFAGGDSKPAFRCMIDCGVKNILFSFFYIQRKRQKDFDELMEKLAELREEGGYSFILDSGGFTYKDVSGRTFQTVRSSSEATKGHKLDPYEYLEEYTKYLVEYGHLFDVVAEFDPVESFGSYSIVDENREKMLSIFEEHKVEVNLMPIWAESERPISQWEEWANDPRYKHLGLICDDIRLATRFVNLAHQHGKKVHGFAQTNILDLKRAKFDTVDSTGWISGQKYGEVFIFQSGKWTRLNATQKSKRKLYKNYFKSIGVDWNLINKDDPNELLRAACISWKRLFDHFEARDRLEDVALHADAAVLRPSRGLVLKMREKDVLGEGRKKKRAYREILINGEVYLFPEKLDVFDLEDIEMEAELLADKDPNEIWEETFGVGGTEVELRAEASKLCRRQRAKPFYPDWVKLKEVEEDAKQAVKRAKGTGLDFSSLLIEEPQINIAPDATLDKDETDYNVITHADENSGNVQTIDGQIVPQGKLTKPSSETADELEKRASSRTRLLKDKLSALACHTCSINAECQYAKPGYLCYYKPAFQTFSTRRVEDTLEALQYLADKNIERAIRAVLFEEVQLGGQVDPQTSAVMSQAFGQLKELRELQRETSPDSFKISVEGYGEAGTSVIGRFFGAKSDKRELAHAQPRVLESEERIIDVTPKSATMESASYDITELATIHKSLTGGTDK